MASPRSSRYGSRSASDIPIWSSVADPDESDTEAPAELAVRPSAQAPRGLPACKESGEVSRPAGTAARTKSGRSLAVMLVPYILLLLLIRILRVSAHWHTKGQGPKSRANIR